MIDPRYVAAALEGFVRGGASVVGDIVDFFRDRTRLQAAAERIDKIFKNPRAPWRSVKVIAPELHDKAPYDVTRVFLNDYLRAWQDRTPNSGRDPAKGEDLWIMRENWEWDDPPPGKIASVLRRDPTKPNNKGILKK